MNHPDLEAQFAESNPLAPTGILLAGEGMSFLTDEHRVLLERVATAFAGGRAVEATVVVSSEVDQGHREDTKSSREGLDPSRYMPLAFAAERQRRHEAEVTTRKAAVEVQQDTTHGAFARRKRLDKALDQAIADLEAIDEALSGHLEVSPDHAKELIWGLLTSDYEDNRHEVARELWRLASIDSGYALEVASRLIDDPSAHVCDTTLFELSRVNFSNRRKVFDVEQLRPLFERGAQRVNGLNQDVERLERLARRYKGATRSAATSGD